MKVRSDFTNKLYDPLNSIFILNPLQAAKFFKHGAVVYDMILNHDETKWVFVFDRNEVAPLMELWNKRELP